MLTSLCLIAAVSSLRAPIEVADLRCEYLRSPLGVDELKPRLSWVLKSDERGQRQSGFEILVATAAENLSEKAADLWRSGKVDSDQTNQIDYAGKALKARMECWWKVRIWDGLDRPSAWSAPAHWSVGLLDQANWRADWIGVADPGQKDGELAKPRLLRKEFSIGTQKIHRAMVYVSALGLYELHLNGKRVGDHLLAPEWTNYFKRVQYQAYDVTSLLKPGQNTLGSILGNGWYSGAWQRWESKLRPIYGTQPFLRLQLEVENSDGTKKFVCSDGSWQGTAEGPVRFSGIYEGETYDARKELPGWDLNHFLASGWSTAEAAHPKVGQMTWQRSEPIRATQQIQPVSLREPKPGVYVFDLGQNIAGWCSMRMHETANAQVTMQFNEVLNPDGTVYMDNLHAGHLSTGDRQIDRYICSGKGSEKFEPHFTYHGFRYVQVTGLKSRPSLHDLAGCVFHTAFTKTGSFSCSDSLLNRLEENIQWSQRANMMGVPTDCCQRDERCGYTGDAQFFMPTAVYNFDVAPFYNKWLVDVCEDSQMPEGEFADHAPTFGPGDHWNVGWSDAGIICPYNIWRTYGDTKVIREHYAAMKRKLALLAKTSPDFVHTAGIGNGDWLNLGGGASPPVIGTAYDANDFRMMSEMAAAIGERQDAATFGQMADRFASGFANAFIGIDGSIKDSSQTGYALAFTMGLAPAPLRNKMAGQFAAEIGRFKGHLATGFIGTPRLLPALHAAGRDDLAYQLLLQRGYPSWLYPVTLGATTMWERWNGWTPEKGYEDSGMNSFNHYAFGAVGQYLFGMVGGIQAGAPGYRHILIQPVVHPGLSWAKTTYASIEGPITSNWQTHDGRLELDIEVPVNTTAEVRIPTKSASRVMESGRRISDVKSIRYLGSDHGAPVYAVGSGRYRFEVPKP